MAAAVVVVLVAVNVGIYAGVGVGLYIVWRIRSTSKVELHPVSGGVGGLDNPVYGGEYMSVV